MKLKIYTTMSPTTKTDNDSDNDIDIARQQLDTAKEKVASSLKIFDKYKQEEDALWKIADEAWIRAVSASKASREAEDRLKSSRSKVKEAEDNLAEITSDGISKISPRSVLDRDEITTADVDNTDFAVEDDNDVKKAKSISPDRLTKARDTPLPLSPSSIIMRSSSLASIAEEEHQQPLASSSPGEQRRTSESNTLTTRKTVPSSSKTMGGGIVHAICITDAGASETNGIYQLAHVSSGGAPMYTKEGTWAGSKRTFLLSSYVSGGSGKRSWMIWIAATKKSLYIINCKENRKAPPEVGWKAKKRRYRPAPKLILISPTERQLENFTVSNGGKVPFVRSQLVALFRSWKS